MKYASAVVSFKEIFNREFFIFHKLENRENMSNLSRVYCNSCFLSNIMSLKSYLFILFIIFCSSAGSIVLLLFYMNPLPWESQKIAFSLMALALFLTSSSLLAPLVFFIKKIYYRGDVSLLTMNTSVRQAILFTLGCLAMLFLYYFRIFEPKLIAMIWATVGCLEVMMQVLD